jgi:hypothetical protein
VRRPEWDEAPAKPSVWYRSPNQSATPPADSPAPRSERMMRSVGTVLCSASQSSQTAAVFERLITEVSITERRHSLFGQRLNVAPEASCRGPDWVTVILPDGRRRHVRRVATDLVPASTDAHPVSERGNARISVRTLLPLADCLRTLLRISREEVPDDQSRSRTSDQPSIQPATGLSDGVPDAVVGPATGCAAADRPGIRRHDGPDACGKSPRNSGDPSC